MISKLSLLGVICCYVLYTACSKHNSPILEFYCFIFMCAPERVRYDKDTPAGTKAGTPLADGYFGVPSDETEQPAQQHGAQEEMQQHGAQEEIEESHMSDDTNELIDRVIRVKRRRTRSSSTSCSAKYHHRRIKKHSVLTNALDYMHRKHQPMHPGLMSAELIQSMMSLLKSTMDRPGEKKKGLWKFCEPSIVKAAWVYGQSAHAHQVLHVDVGETPYSSWYPCLVAYNTSDPGCQNVLCKPLLENGCKRPFRTHESRLVHINSHAPHPQHFDHSEEVIEPQPEHFERSTVETMLGGNIDGDDGKHALTGPGSLRNYMSCRIDCMRGHGILDPPSCH